MVDFLRQYARARELQADKLFEECLQIADEAKGDVEVVADGKGGLIERVNTTRISSTRFACRHPRVDGRQARAQEIRRPREEAVYRPNHTRH
jgi:hypothetical protein